jgi:hypothetical protein
MSGLQEERQVRRTLAMLAVFLLGPGAIACAATTEEAGSGGAGSEPVFDGGRAGTGGSGGWGGSIRDAAGPRDAQPDTGAGGGCANVGRVDYGDCEMEIGWGFDGERCRSFSGCGCQPNCDRFFDDPLSCAASCVAAGGCNLSVMRHDLFLGQMCDTVYVCVDPASVAGIDGIFNGVSCPGDGGWSCTGSATCDTDYGSYYITEQHWQEICALSLLPEVLELVCMVWL